MSEINEMLKNVSAVVSEHMKKSRACKIAVTTVLLVIGGVLLYNFGYIIGTTAGHIFG